MGMTSTESLPIAVATTSAAALSESRVSATALKQTRAQLAKLLINWNQSFNQSFNFWKVEHTDTHSTYSHNPRDYDKA